MNRMSGPCVSALRVQHPRRRLIILATGVNVSDFALPDARPEFPGEEADFVDPHITNTVFSLDWHQDESFRSALNGSAAPVCATITTGNFLPNVTNLFTDDNDSADCEPVLGRDCVDAILASGRDLDACSFDIWTDLPECAASLGASAFYDTYGLSILSFDMNRNATGGNASFAEVGYEAIANGTDGQYGFFSQSSDPYSAANTTLFDEEATRLHVMVLSFAPDRSGVGLWSQKAMCVRANATRLNVEDGRPSDGDGGEGSGGGNISNVASTLTAGTGNMGSALALAGLWLAAFARL